VFLKSVADGRRLALSANMLTDFRQATRGLMRSPGFTATAVLTLALGIGGSAAMFTIVNRVVLNPLPFPDAHRLVLLWGSKPHEGQPEIPFSQPDFEDLRARATRFDGIGAWALGRGTVSGGEPEYVQYAVVTANLLQLLSVEPQLGRGFTESQDAPGTRALAVISHGLWQRRFGGSRGAVGATVTLDDRALEIIGVLPSRFSFLTFPAETDIWLPLGADPSNGRRYARGARSMGVLARLRRGVSLAAARGEVDTIASGLAATHPRFNTGRRIVMVPLSEQVSRGVRDGTLVLLAAVVCVLLIGCANVAGLLLARGSTRQRELTIRAALGASRERLLRFQLTESIVLASIGGAAGLLLGVWVLDLLLQLPLRTDSLFVPYSVPRQSIQLDPAAVGFTAAITAITAVLFGLLPAWPAARAAASDDTALRGGMRTTSGRRQHRARAGLVIAEVAVAVMLLVSAGLLLRAFARVSATDPGFRPDRILSMEIALSRTAYAQPERATGFFRESLERLSTLPAVQRAAAVEYLPMSGLDSSSGFYIDGRPAPDRADEQRTHFRSISSEYFAVMGIPLIAGRPFSDRDDSSAARVAIINETMARRYWPGENAIGKRLALDLETMRFFPNRPPTVDIPSGMREIVGIVRDVRHESLNAAAVPELYVPYLQRSVTNMTLVLRTSTDETALIGPARAAIREVDPDQPIARVDTLSNLVRSSIAQPRANSVLLSCFAGIAVLLSVIGIYGLLAFAVSQRTSELGIRLALGGQPSDILRMVLTDGARLVFAGIVLGIPLAILAATGLRRLLFGIQPFDVSTLAGAVLLMLVAGVGASYLPARRATRVDPIAALRAE
jgi:putative ABC transport system permease protein